MYGHFDGILTCPDLSCASRGGFRRAYVPLHRVQNGLMYLNLALRTSTWALYAQHEANLGHFGTILEPSWDHFEAILGSSVACFFVLRFSALRALILDSAVLLLCLAACCRDKGAHAKNTVKYIVF